MVCLLVSGFRNTGKTTVLCGFANSLQGKGYSFVAGDPIPPPGVISDLQAILKNTLTNTTVLINTKSDYPHQAGEMHNFYNNNVTIDVIITSIRDGGYERTAFMTVLTHLSPKNIIELPLGKINGSRVDFNIALPAYLNRTEQLLQFIAATHPFNI